MNALVTFLRRMQQRAASQPAPVRARTADASLGTADELASLDAAIRRDD